MCTALTLKTKDGYNLFGRNMDVEYNFNQAVHLIPRNFSYKNHATGKTEKTSYAILGMATLIDNHPCLADGLNEKGLGCAGLNFPGYVHYEDYIDPNKINIPPYDILLWILSNFETIDEVKTEMEKVNIVKVPLGEQIPLPTLHWMVTDKSGRSIVIENTKEKLSIYENKIGALTNSPTFDWHLTNLRQYMGLSSHQPHKTMCNDQELTTLGQGQGSFSLPGDPSTVSRFIRIAFFRSRAHVGEDELSAVTEFFHLLSSVAMIKGSVITEQEKDDITLYTSCMCQEKGIYYYSTYTNHRINAINMNKEDLDAKEIKIFEYKDQQDIHYQN